MPKHYVEKYVPPDCPNREPMGSAPALLAKRSHVRPRTWCPKDLEYDPWCDPDNPKTILPRDVYKAAAEIGNELPVTPLIKSKHTFELGYQVHYKLECFNRCHSASERGAHYILKKLPHEQGQDGVYTASTGEWGKALALKARQFKVPLTVVLPIGVSNEVCDDIRAWGATAIKYGRNLAEAKRQAFILKNENGHGTYLNGYDHPHSIAASGIIGKEILEQLPETDAILIPVGGGGLIAGISTLVKQRKPEVLIYGIEPDQCCSFFKAMENERPYKTECSFSIADSLAVPLVGYNAYHTAISLIDKMKDLEYDPWCDPDNPKTILPRDVYKAAAEIGNELPVTPLIKSKHTFELGYQVHYKLECFNRCHSASERGAHYILKKLPHEQGQDGVYTASTGEWGKALALKARQFKVPLTVVLPIGVSNEVCDDIRAWGATAIKYGRNLAEAKRQAFILKNENGHGTYLNGYDHPHSIAASGIIGKEILEQLPETDAILIPVGGGGLIAGISTLVKQRKPEVLIYGIEPDQCCSFFKAMENERPYKTECSFSIADSLAVPLVGYNAYHTAISLIDKMKDLEYDPWCDPDNPKTILPRDVYKAAAEIGNELPVTPLIKSKHTFELGYQVHYKLECFNRCHSASERGAHYILKKLPHEQGQDGVYTASTGEWGKALALKARQFKVPLTVVLPIGVSNEVCDDIRAWGATAIKYGRNLAEAKRQAFILKNENGHGTYLNGYDHPHSIAASGIIGKEILEQLPETDAILIPVGGGGLIAGISTLVKQRKPEVLIYGIEPDQCCSFFKAMENERPYKTECSFSIADSLAVPLVGYNAYHTAISLIDKMEDFDEYCDPDNPRLIKYEDVLDAAGRLKNVIVKTPCIVSYITLISRLVFYETGTFKERGTLNALQLLPTDKKKLGVAIASLGNEALGFCYHANKLNVPVFVVMPFTVNISTMQKLHSINAKVIIQGANLMDSQKYARALARDRGLTYINGRDHPHILAGYGTVALEILDQLPCVDAIILPVGTGGLAGAVATVVKKAKPNCLVYGVQPELNPGFVKSLEMESPTMTSLQSTLADSIAVPNVGCNSFANAAPLLDKMLLVTEDWIAKSMLHYWEQERYVIEGAGACPLAAIIGHLVPELKLKKVVCICTGGNVDMTMYSRCLTKGFAVEGRLVKFTISINDSTSAKSRILDLLAEGGYNVITAFQNREWMESDTYTIEMKLAVEAKNLEHALELKRSLDRAYTGKIVFETEPFNDKRTCPCYVRKKDCEK